ncbi:MAG TPA: glycosyltransferase [Spirochaetota bacterium]|nr:glycosyltransferase [Spirochaetota bacterium]HPF05323.1 glycosyltransferase [Spirochaetota bacterium]HPJ41060.1 glycosyltransferase [Spirochaetota bacterium]HRX46715.1 glycosyltransferase [Spirochaetota bacterium]
METYIIVFYLFILVLLSIYGANRYYTIYLFKKHRHDKIVPLSNFNSLPKVTIQLPVFNEKYVVERLIDYVSRIRYPRDLMEIQVLDDSTDDTREIAKKKCEEKRKEGFNINYIHRTDRTGFKAGALENGLNITDGEFIAVFDADFLPPEDFLERTIHYFTDDNIGMIQARWDHVNRRYSLLTECQSILLDGHFMIEHTARNRSGRFFNFNGTAGIWRKKTIIDAGGWQHDTLTEDLDLSYRAQLRGWQFIYLPDLTVPAELPIEMTAFKSQQFRWAKGSIQTFLKLKGRILKADVSPKIKLEAFFHIGANFAYALMTLLTLFMPLVLVIRFNNGYKKLFYLDLPIFICATLSVFLFYFYTEYVVIKETLSVKNRSTAKPLMYLPFVVAIGIGLCINNSKAVLEAVIRKESPFNRTPKYNVSDGERTSMSDRVKNVFGNVYRTKKIDAVSLIELTLAVYMTYAVYFTYENDLYFSLPLILLFQIGFFYTSLLSIVQAPLSVFVRRRK